jgi:PAS domain-containing protein
VLGWLLIFGRRGSMIDRPGRYAVRSGDDLIFVGIVAWSPQLRKSPRAVEDGTRASGKRGAFRLIAENGSDVVSLYSTDGRIVYISPSCERVLGFLPEEMPRMPPWAMVHPQDLDRLQRHFNQLLRGNWWRRSRSDAQDWLHPLEARR